jgi:hypothetical protein
MVIEEDSGLAMSKWKQECAANRKFEFRIRYPNVEISRLFIHTFFKSFTDFPFQSFTDFSLPNSQSRTRKSKAWRFLSSIPIMWREQIAHFIQHLRNSISLIHVSIAAFGVRNIKRDCARTLLCLMDIGAG